MQITSLCSLLLDLITTVSCAILLSYIALVISFAFGWDKIKTVYVHKKTHTEPKLSCVIPFRDEENNLAQIIQCLNEQVFSTNNFEVIFVDDHSTDNSNKIVSDLIKGHENYTLIKNSGQGKKSAISSAIHKTTFDYIITSDADCRFSTLWLKSIAQYIADFSPDLLIGPVALKGSNHIFHQFQIIDFLSLITSGAGAVGIRKPIMCNGANLITRKEILIEAQNTIHNNYASGDDIFLLQYCKKRKKSIHFLKCKDAIVYSYTVNSLKQFFSQRVRWASKSKGYTDFFTLCVAFIVFLSNTLMIVAPIYIFINLKHGLILLSIALIKTVVDYYLLRKGSAFFLDKFSFKYFLFTQTVYPFYIVSTVIWALFGTVHWKNRKVK